MKLELANGRKIEVTQEEIDEFITQELIPNPYWKFSKLLSENDLMKYLKNENTRNRLIMVARYLLIYMENISFTGYLFDKSEGQPGPTKEFNMPVVEKLREMYRTVNGNDRSLADLSGDVHEMFNACMEVGVDPL